MRTSSTVYLLTLPVVVGLTAGDALSQEEGTSLADVFERVRTSVVRLDTAEETELRDQQGVAAKQGGIGSGVLLEGGRILTAAHVVHSADQVVVEYADGTRVRASVVGSVVQSDVALLQVDETPPPNIRPAVLGDSDAVRIGSACFVVGAPRGLSHTLTAGHISARRVPGDSTVDFVNSELFQTDAAINPGNSGGPMFDMAGRVIGIVSYRRNQSEGLAFAVTANTARRLLLDRGALWSGMTEVFLTGTVARALQIPEGRSGFLLQRVAKGSPADRLGLRGGSIPATIGDTPLLLGGDILLEAMGRRLDSRAAGLEIMNSLQGVEATTRISVVILRSGQGLRLEATASDLAPWMFKEGSR